MPSQRDVCVRAEALPHAEAQPRTACAEPRDAAPRARLRGAGARVARGDVDDAAEGVGAVHHRAGAAHDLDALDVFEIGEQAEAGAGRAAQIVVERVAVERGEHAAAGAAEPREATDAEERSDAIIGDDHATDAGERLGDRLIAERLDLLPRHQRHARRRFVDALRRPRRSGDAVDPIEPCEHPTRALGRDVDAPLDWLVVVERDAHEVCPLCEPSRHRRRRADESPIDLDARVALAGIDQHGARPPIERHTRARRRVGAYDDRLSQRRVTRRGDHDYVRASMAPTTAPPRAAGSSTAPTQTPGTSPRALATSPI